MVYENGLLLIVALISCTPLAAFIMGKIRAKLNASLGEEKAYNIDRVFKTVVVIALFALCTVRLAGDSYNPFIYFKF